MSNDGVLHLKTEKVIYCDLIDGVNRVSGLELGEDRHKVSKYGSIDLFSLCELGMETLCRASFFLRHDSQPRGLRIRDKTMATGTRSVRRSVGVKGVDSYFF